ncbi:MAG: hypothetical protein ACKVOK_09285 [Flavobacteriales bacterium]
MNTHLKNFALVLLFGMFALFAAAQPDVEPVDGKRKEKLDALKRAYITDKLELTSAEAEKFWPVFNEFEKKRASIRKEIASLNDKVNGESVSDKELIEAIDAIDKKRKEEVDLDSKFLKDCLPILGAKKVVILSRLERDFRKKMMEALKERRQNRGGGQRGPGGRPNGPGRN